MNCKQSFAAMLALLVGATAQAGGVASIDADLVPTRSAEEIESIVGPLVAAAGGGVIGSKDDSSILSLRCTRADRVLAAVDELGEPDARLVWVVEVKDDRGPNGSFYVIDDSDGSVLAHGVVAAR